MAFEGQLSHGLPVIFQTDVNMWFTMVMNPNVNITVVYHKDLSMLFKKWNWLISIIYVNYGVHEL